MRKPRACKAFQGKSNSFPENHYIVYNNYFYGITLTMPLFRLAFMSFKFTPKNDEITDISTSNISVFNLSPPQYVSYYFTERYENAWNLIR